MCFCQKKIVMKAKEKVRKKAHFKKIMKKVEMIVFNFGVFMCFICFPVTFLFISFNNDSGLLTILLAIFSVITTFVFEFLEWIELKSKSKIKSKNQNKAMVIIPAIFMVFLLILFSINKFKPNLYFKLNNYINKATRVPNIVTTFSFILYFVSTFLRNRKQQDQIP